MADTRTGPVEDVNVVPHKHLTLVPDRNGLLSICVPPRTLVRYTKHPSFVLSILSPCRLVPWHLEGVL